MGAPERAARVLVVDDDDAIRQLLRTILTRRNYQVRVAGSGDEALDNAVECKPDLVILDLTLPGLDGLDVCRELRTWLSAPILVLSGTGEENAKVAALDGGADDYLTKPFAMGELLARIRALLRRAAGAAVPTPAFVRGDLRVDFARRRVYRQDEEIRLTRTEFDILTALTRNVGCVVTSRTLVDRVWGDQYADTQTLRVHVGNLRKKIEPDPATPRYILTETGIGYRFADV